MLCQGETWTALTQDCSVAAAVTCSTVSWLGSLRRLQFGTTMRQPPRHELGLTGLVLNHLAYIEKLRAVQIHVGDTPDGAWGLYSPKARREVGRWLTLFAVRYDLAEKPSESAKEELAHDGQGFASCSFVRWMGTQNPTTLEDWDRKLCELYRRL